MNKILLLSACFVLASICGWGAIFANDAIVLFLDGKRLTGNSVLVRYDAASSEKLALCEKGAFWLCQGPTWGVGPYTFIQVAGEEIMTFANWVRTPEGRASKDLNSDYQHYLQGRSKESLRQVTIMVPTIEESPALDKTPNPPPSRGMVGGKLGYDRFFRVNLENGEINIITRHQAFELK
ncbi:hypothetical protein [Trichlorobacter sp.]|jgi:hypothetical protein|uniref:hypothetical protein n=1 Tax=Trichlorobacter sp. TaxID=2911007 RepID=UPI00297B1F07|nr:hypothetical protein [Trichlorobacter sp.]MDD3523320.1 hypothetical protein [Candidatus Cloacimonadota bacterium]MDY0385278.1 hypothetical protein [Trichlorobacter sp.]